MNISTICEIESVTIRLISALGVTRDELIVVVGCGTNRLIITELESSNVAFDPSSALESLLGMKYIVSNGVSFEYQFCVGVVK